MELFTGPKRGAVADPRVARLRMYLNNLAVFFLVCAMWITLSLVTSTFATTGNITNVLRQSSLWSIIAIGQTVVLITAGIDLSIGSVVGLASCIVAIMLNKGYPISVSCIFTCLCGLGVGAVHAFGITKGTRKALRDAMQDAAIQCSHFIFLCRYHKKWEPQALRDTWVPP